MALVVYLDNGKLKKHTVTPYWVDKSVFISTSILSKLICPCNESITGLNALHGAHHVAVKYKIFLIIYYKIY